MMKRGWEAQNRDEMDVRYRTGSRHENKRSGLCLETHLEAAYPSQAQTAGERLLDLAPTKFTGM